MGKNKAKLPHFHACIRYMSCFDSTHAPVATAACAAGTGLVSMSTRPDIPGMLHLERETGDWSTYNEYSYRIILQQLLLYVYCSRARPRFPSKFRRRRLQDFFYLYRKLTKILVGRQFSFLCGRQVHFQKRTFANTLFKENVKNTVYIYEEVENVSCEYDLFE